MASPLRQAPRQAVADATAIADRLHSAAIHLLRRLRAEDDATGLSPPRLSALSVVVFAGPIALSDLALAERVSLPTVSRLAKELESQGLVRRATDKADTRVQRLAATALGRKLLQEGRARRVARLATEIARLPAADLRTLAAAATLLETLLFPKSHPTQTARGPGRAP
jgi:DNA-binding MarR family transcriptional regulator